MREAMRLEDLVARVGGDEFVIVAGSLNTSWDAQLLAGKITQAVSRPLRVRGVDMVPSISIGIAIAEPDEDPSTTLRRADAALYQCKSRRDGIASSPARAGSGVSPS
jgi:diguanylate cyclase (GGDEF)-like protein